MPEVPQRVHQSRQFRAGGGQPYTRIVRPDPVPSSSGRVSRYLSQLTALQTAQLADVLESAKPSLDKLKHPTWTAGVAPPPSAVTGQQLTAPEESQPTRMAMLQRIEEEAAKTNERATTGHKRLSGGPAPAPHGPRPRGATTEPGRAPAPADRAEGQTVGTATPGKWWTPERQQQGIDYLMKNAGLPEQSARAMVARWSAFEAPGGPTSVNPKSGAYGIAQWLGARKAGVPSTYEGQLAKVVSELKTTEGAAYRNLLSAKTETEAAAAAGSYERAGKDERLGQGKTIAAMRSMGTGQPAAPMTSLDTTIPSDVLDRARDVAYSSGSGGVQRFMREQGYPMSGNWCGEFAASVVRSSGGVPPRSPAIASNWRNYGTPVVGTPQPGDIAVRRGPPTGSTGSHVTFVESVNPQTGRFAGIGGNQGAWRSQYQLSHFEFRRPPGRAVTEAVHGTTPSVRRQAPNIR